MQPIVGQRGVGPMQPIENMEYTSRIVGELSLELPFFRAK
jgi:hypothetical protein